MRTAIRTWLVLLSSLALVLVPATAFATTDDEPPAGDGPSPDIQEEEAEEEEVPLSETDVELMQSELEASGEAAAQVYCKWAAKQRYIRTQAYYTQRVDWCYDGNNIVGTPVVKITVSAGPQVNFVGNINQTRAWLRKPTSYTAYTQGHFKAENISWSNWYPWVDMTVRGDGTWSGSTGS